jgi:hypothetical protein
MSKKDSKKTEKPQEEENKAENTLADAEKDAETEEKDTGPKTPYAEGTDKYNIAKALIAGETDRKKLVRELGVKINTIYNVTTELTTLGYPLAIHEKKKSPLFTSTPTSTSTSTSTRTTQKTPKALSDLSPKQIDALLKLAGQPAGVSSEPGEENGSGKISPETSPAISPAQNPPQDSTQHLASERSRDKDFS